MRFAGVRDPAARVSVWVFGWFSVGRGGIVSVVGEDWEL